MGDNTPRIKVPGTPKVKDKNHVPEWHTQQELYLKDGLKSGLVIVIYTTNHLKNLIDKICGLLYQSL